MSSYPKCNKRWLALIVLPLTLTAAFAQDRCGTVEIQQAQRSKKLIRETDEQFESWLRKQKDLRASGRAGASGPYVIPVVVHVIHNGEAVGTGTNISDAQILSEINVLNKDYNRKNADTTSTPEVFKPVASSLSVTFVLARQTPDGLPTSGIMRVKGTKTTWSTGDDATLKALSYWPAEKYLNIWVANLSSSLLGYSQFPVSSLPGLEEAEDNRLTDGVVIDYAVFGSADDGSFSLLADFRKGRTATHEIGHFLGLRHIWGDDNGACTGTDYVNDTPNQGNSTSGCPSVTQSSCGVQTMFQNYMDYTNDNCMNLFTSGQVDRMITVLENSPRRLSLLTSSGALDPAPVANDLSILSLTSPVAHVCAGDAAPVVQVVNKGTNVISHAQLRLSVNNAVVETRDFVFAQPLQPLMEEEVTFQPVTLTPGITYSLKAEILQTNGTTDGKVNDNVTTSTTEVPATEQLPFTQTFATLPSTWKVVNPDGKTTWTLQTVPRNTASTNALLMYYFAATESSGETDALFTPAFDLSTAVHPFVSFELAYATNGIASDGLKVYVMTDCSQDLSKGTQVYFKSGSALSTAGSVSTSFVPSGADQWRTDVIDLKDFIGQPHVQLAFVGINGKGNNLYLDNVSVTGQPLSDVAINRLINPTVVTCNTSGQPLIEVRNAGSDDVHTLSVAFTLNNATHRFDTPDDFILAAGQTAQITLPAVTLNDGSNTLAVALNNPNGFDDLQPADNTLTRYTVVNASADRIPLRESFDDDYEASWTIVKPFAGVPTGVTAETNYQRSILFPAEKNSVDNNEMWIVSPVLDLTGTQQASVFFDVSYFSGGSFTRDRFQVLASTDCGASYDQVLMDENGTTLSAIARSSVNTPQSARDWKKEFINLDAFAGKDQVRLAFVFSNAEGNNLLLDNIEFFVSDNPAPLALSDAFAIYGTDPSGPPEFYITFHLNDKQPVQYELLDVTGRKINGDTFNEVLNQTYTIAADHAGRGMYFLRLRIGDQVYSTKLLLGK